MPYDPQIDEALKHAVLANADGEIKSIAIILLTHGDDPEIHMAVSTDTVCGMNAATDMLKVEMLKLMTTRAEQMKPRR